VSQKPSRRHHLLPQFYMRAFADERQQATVRERETGRDFTTHTKNIFVETDYYTVTSEEAENDHGLIEGLYAKVEGVAAPIFEALRRDNFPLSDQDRSEFASFMALQITRGRLFRDFMERATEQMGKAMLRTAAEAPPGYWERKHAEWEANPEGPEPPPTMTERERRTMREGTGFDIRPSREHVVEMSFASLEEMTFVLFAMNWRLVSFREPCLFTSEHPISYWREPSPADRMMGIGPATADEVRFPLSPTRALVLVPPTKPGEEAIYDCNVAAAARLNWGTLTFPPAHRLLLNPELPGHPLPGITELRGL
jgi:hypothetical protein